MTVSQAVVQQVLRLARGSYLVIGDDQAVKLVKEVPTIEKVYKAISTPERECVCCDTITLRMAGAGGVKDPIVMMVDDTGMLENLPINEVATYIAQQVKGYPHQIHGTVVIVNDADFRS